MKNHFTVFMLAILLLPFGSMAQTLPNPGFENWESSGSQPPFDWEDPVDWSSSNRVTEFVSAGVRKTGDAHSGDSAVVMAPTNAPGQRTELVNGEPQYDFGSLTMMAITGGTPISTMPKYLNGFYKYMPDEDGDDTAYAEVILKKYNTTSGMYDTVAYGKRQFTASSAYGPFEVAIKEKMTGVTADSIVVHFVILTHAGTGPPPAGKLFLDDLSLNNVSGVAHSPAVRSFTVAPVPAKDRMYIRQQDETATATATLLSLDGKEIMEQEISESGSSLDVADIPEGIYLLRVTSPKGIAIQKVLVQR